MLILYAIILPRILMVAEKLHARYARGLAALPLVWIF
jgi:hypothetical protein